MRLTNASRIRIYVESPIRLFDVCFGSYTSFWPLRPDVGYTSDSDRDSDLPSGR